MSYFTLVFGLALVGLAAYAKLGLGSNQWQALMPLVVGLAFMTIGEGMRSMKKHRHLFLGLAILLSFITIAATFRYAELFPVIVVGREAALADGQTVRAEIIYTLTILFSACVLYLFLALPALFRKRHIGQVVSIPAK